MSSRQSLYNEVVTITENYFGPAADRFVIRQIRNHLNKDPEQLGKQDLLRLIKWISLAMALLVEDEKLISKYSIDLQRLANNHSQK
jgi:hypothetical protein